MTLKTSRKQVPASAKILTNLAPNWQFAKKVLNFGCGKFPELTQEYLINFHKQVMQVTNYDPNSKSEDVITDISLIAGDKERFCVVLCANVLNVCKDLDAVLADLAKVDFDTCVIQIYEGSNNGTGRKTRDGYQRNEPVAAYVAEINKVFPKHDVTLHRAAKCITVIKRRNLKSM